MIAQQVAAWLGNQGCHFGQEVQGFEHFGPCAIGPDALELCQNATSLHAQPVEMIDLAPTLARVLAVSPPNLSEGRPLLEALKPPAWRALKP